MKDKLIELYRMYQFRLEEENEKCLVFSYRMGIFRSIEIVRLKDTMGCKKEAARFEKEYREAGWSSINITFYATIEKAEKTLFDSFFYIKEARQRLKAEYNEFCNLQTNRLQSKYTYVPSNYCNAEERMSADLVEYVVKNAKNQSARLTILEAAAGYGKTCTVYEILHQLVLHYPERIPLFIELSKNRMANIFLYVLQNEINDKFTQLSTELVIEEIKKGKIPLIIDGFDELIQWKKSIELAENPDEQSLSMLSTIADLLGEDSKAWILLTSRRSAIFTGDIFDEWVSTKLGSGCVVERLQILKPSVREWIGEEKYACMCDKRIAIDNISNPVLLTMIRNQSLDDVKEMITNEDTILEKYFIMLLEREETRQLLTLSVEKLYTIMEKLAADFAQYDIIADARDFIQDLLYEILKDDLMEFRIEYREKHGHESMVSNEDYIGRILNNSLLDRASMTSNQIGFINEFILGILVGDSVCDGYLLPEELLERLRFIDISATAFSSRSERRREEYYKLLKGILESIGGQSRLNVELNLLNKNDSNYENEYFNGLYFQKYHKFDTAFKFINCTFSSCVFNQCEIQAEVFESSKFFNCQFFDITVNGTIKDAVFLGCRGHEMLEKKDSGQQIQKEHVDKYEKIILEQFWKPGYNSAEPRRTYTALFKGIDSKDNHKIEIALKALLKKNLLRELNVCYEINTTKMKEIKEILGRE